MGTFFVTQKLWELDARKHAQREISKAKILFYGFGDGQPSWKEKILGRRNTAASRYREGGKKIIMV